MIIGDYHVCQVGYKRKTVLLRRETRPDKCSEAVGRRCQCDESDLTRALRRRPGNVQGIPRNSECSDEVL